MVKWIKKAIKKKGSYRACVKHRFGKKGFTDRGTIKQSVINKDKKHSNPKIRKRAQLANTLKRMKHNQRDVSKLPKGTQKNVFGKKVRRIGTTPEKSRIGTKTKAKGVKKNLKKFMYRNKNLKKLLK